MKDPKKYFVLSTISAQPWLEHSQKNTKKKNSTTIQKIKKRHSGFISSQTGLGEAEKKYIYFEPGTIFAQPWSEHSQKIQKKIGRKFKKLKKKNIILASFLAKPGQDKRKKGK